MHLLSLIVFTNYCHNYTHRVQIWNLILEHSKDIYENQLCARKHSKPTKVCNLL